MTQKTNFRHSVSLADSFSFHHERCLGTLSISLRFARLGGTPNWLHLRRGRYCDIVDCFKLDKFQMLSSWHPFPFPCLKLQALNVNQNQRGNRNVSIAWCPILSHDSLFQSYLPETPNSLQKFGFSITFFMICQVLLDIYVKIFILYHFVFFFGQNGEALPLNVDACQNRKR